MVKRNSHGKCSWTAQICIDNSQKSKKRSNFKGLLRRASRVWLFLANITLCGAVLVFRSFADDWLFVCCVVHFAVWCHHGKEWRVLIISDVCLCRLCFYIYDIVLFRSFLVQIMITCAVLFNVYKMFYFSFCSSRTNKIKTMIRKL